MKLLDPKTLTWLAVLVIIVLSIMLVTLKLTGIATTPWPRLIATTAVGVILGAISVLAVDYIAYRRRVRARRR